MASQYHYLLTPEQTTETGVIASSSKSALTSHVSLTPLCTPPSPPVAKMGIDANRQPIRVEETVVPPDWLLANAIGRSRRDIFLSLFSPLQR